MVAKRALGRIISSLCLITDFDEALRDLYMPHRNIGLMHQAVTPVAYSHVFVLGIWLHNCRDGYLIGK
jgi:hypothetical protein